MNNNDDNENEVMKMKKMKWNNNDVNEMIMMKNEINNGNEWNNDK